jgi:hypothetical protein
VPLRWPTSPVQPACRDRAALLACPTLFASLRFDAPALACWPALTRASSSVAVAPKVLPCHRTWLSLRCANAPPLAASDTLHNASPLPPSTPATAFRCRACAATPPPQFEPPLGKLSAAAPRAFPEALHKPPTRWRSCRTPLAPTLTHPAQNATHLLRFRVWSAVTGS